MKTKSAAEQLAQLGNCRAVAERLNLSTPGERWLRALLIEVLTTVIGDELANAHRTDLENSGALFAPPALRIFDPAPPPTKGAAPAVAPVTQQPGRALTLAEAAVIGANRRAGRPDNYVAPPEGEPAPAAAAAPIIVEDPSPDPNVPDPAKGWLGTLAANLGDEDEISKVQ
jgi:hypothetical protein